jgi:GT2 family glycosyltransferase
MSISVIVSNLNGARYLPKLLESLKRQEDVSLQIIIVDRNSTDESARILAEHPEVQVISEPPETGLVAGYARGAQHARHEHLFFSNEDMWFSPSCLALTRRQFDVEGVGRVGAVMPKQLSYDGTRLIHAGTWFTHGRWNQMLPYPFRSTTHRDYTEPYTICGINAGACMVSRTAYDEVGGWDPTFFLDYEDLDLNIRLWQRGWTCRVEPRALVYHAVGASNAKVIHQGRSTVGRKRYVAALSNQVVIALKSFTGWGPLLAPVLLADRLGRDLGRLRFESARLDLEAMWLTLQRLPAIVQYRQQNRTLNQQHPGQRYFTDPRFDVETAS